MRTSSIGDRNDGQSYAAGNRCADKLSRKVPRDKLDLVTREPVELPMLALYSADDVELLNVNRKYTADR